MRHEFYLRTGNRPPLSNFIVFVDDKMQHDYQYHLVEPVVKILRLISNRN